MQDDRHKRLMPIRMRLLLTPALFCAHVFMQTLHCLPTAPLPGSGTPSALPLGAFPRAPGSDLISLDSVILSMPDLDYQTILTLAQPALARCINDPSVQRHAAALSAGISTLRASQVSAGYSSVQLAMFTGWGMNATNVTLVPDNGDLPSAIAVVCGIQGTPALAASATKEPIAREVGIGVGLFFAGCVVGALVTILAMHIRGRMR